MKIDHSQYESQLCPSFNTCPKYHVKIKDVKTDTSTDQACGGSATAGRGEGTTYSVYKGMFFFFFALIYDKGNLARSGYSEKDCWKPSYSWTARELREHIATGQDPLAVQGWKLELQGWEAEEQFRRSNEEFKKRIEAHQAERKAKREANKIKKQRLSRAYQKEFSARSSMSMRGRS